MKSQGNFGKDHSRTKDKGYYLKMASFFYRPDLMRTKFQINYGLNKSKMIQK